MWVDALILPVPDLFQEVCHVDLLVLLSLKPWMVDHAPWRCPSLRLLLEATFDEVFEVLAPFDAVFWLILQFRDGLADDVGQEIDEACPWLHLRAVCGEGEAVLGYFEESHTKAPDIRGDGVGLALYPLGGHVVRGADERVGVAGNDYLAPRGLVEGKNLNLPLRPKFSADTKITELNLPIFAEEYVRWLNVAVLYEVSRRKPWLCRGGRTMIFLE